MTIKLQEEYGDKLGVLFVEVQGAQPAQAEAFALGRKWLGGESLWTTERPFNIDLKGIPHCALLSADGEVLMAGYTGEIGSAVEKKIEELLKQGGRAPSGTPAAVGKAIASFNKGEYGSALSALEALVAGTDAKLAEAARPVLEERKARIERALARAERVLALGDVPTALRMHAELERGLAGRADTLARVDALKAKLAEPAAEKEAAARKDLAVIEKKLYSKGPEKATLKSLENLAGKHEGTKTVEFVRHLQKLGTQAGGGK